MSFWPLPTILVEALGAAAQRGPLVELGSGDGEFTRRLVAAGLPVIGLDRRPSAAGPSGSVVADLTRLPFARDSVAGFVLANTLRHVPRPRWPQVVDGVFDTSKVGGLAVLLEDEPRGTSPPEHNYRRALDLLARFDPGRGRPLDRDECILGWEPRWGAPRVFGEARNEERVRDPLAPIAWMQARRPAGAPARALEALAASVEERGMEYGRFWFCVFRKETSRA